MIQFSRSGKEVLVTIKTGIGNWEYHPKIDCTHDIHAELLKRQLENQLENLVETIRRDAYLQGWSDKTKKKRKAQYFNPTFVKTVNNAW